MRLHYATTQTSTIFEVATFKISVTAVFSVLRRCSLATLIYATNVPTWLTSTVKMDALGSYETSVTACKMTQYLNPESRSPNNVIFYLVGSDFVVVGMKHRISFQYCVL